MSLNPDHKMGRKFRLTVLVGAALSSAIAVISLANFLLNYDVPNIGAGGTIVGGVITLLGIIFTASYGEISSYYK